MFYWKTK